jgi:hypothetical protein
VCIRYIDCACSGKDSHQASTHIPALLRALPRAFFRTFALNRQPWNPPFSISHETRDFLLPEASIELHFHQARQVSRILHWNIEYWRRSVSIAVAYIPSTAHPGDQHGLAVLAHTPQQCFNPGYGPSATPTAASSPQ